MTEIRFECSKCGQHLETDPEMSGQTIHCPQCMAEMVIPAARGELAASPEEVETNSAPPPKGECQDQMEVRYQKPALVRRRLAAFFADMLVFLALKNAITFVSGSQVFGELCAWVLFFVIWLVLCRKKGMSPGQWLVHVRVVSVEDGGDKSGNLLLRFALVWLPAVILSFLSIGLTYTETNNIDALWTWSIGLMCTWYLAVFLSLVSTGGVGGIPDSLSHTRTEFASGKFLSIWRRASVAVAVLVFAYLNIAAPVIRILWPSVLGASNTSEDQAYDPDYPYDADVITEHRSDRVFEIQTRWQQSGGFLGLSTVWSGGQGSGLLFVNNRKKGLVVSNRHVVDPQRSILGGHQCWLRRAAGEQPVVGHVVAKAKYGLDLALIEIPMGEGWQPHFLPPLAIAEIRQGESCIAIGNALGAGLSVTDGVISRIEDWNGKKMIRTSTPVSPGNSGGPLFLSRGGLWVGIVTLGSNRAEVQNVNYAVPADYVFNENNWEFLIPDATEIRRLLRRELGD